MTEKKEIVSLKEFGKLTHYDEGETWGAGKALEDEKKIFSVDVATPKVQLVQGLSTKITNREAQSGQWVNSITNKILGDVGDPVKFVVVDCFKRWHTFLDPEKKKFLNSEAVTLENCEQPYETKFEGQDVWRRQVLQFLVCLPMDLERGKPRPYILDFAATSKLAGRMLLTFIQELHDSNVPSAAFTFEVGYEKKDYTEGAGTYLVKQIKPLGETKKEYVDLCKKVYREFAKVKDRIIIDDRDTFNTDNQSVHDPNPKTTISNEIQM